MMKKIGVILAIITMLGVCGLATDVKAAGEVVSGNKSLCDPDSGVSDELKKQAGCDLTKNDTAPSVIQSLIEVAIGIVGIGAVAVMIYGGFTYTKSAGDPSKAKKARDILIYGAVGLVVAILAFAIVHFVNISVMG